MNIRNSRTSIVKQEKIKKAKEARLNINYHLAKPKVKSAKKTLISCGGEIGGNRQHFIRGQKETTQKL